MLSYSTFPNVPYFTLLRLNTIAHTQVLQYKNIKFQVWDLGGQTSIRPYWRCYYPNTDAVIFVVDSCDKERLLVAKQELMAMLDVST